MKVRLTRDIFENITEDLLERTVLLTHAMLEEARRKGKGRFHDIILVGGSSRMPQVPQRLKAEFQVEPKMFDPEEAVAKGAAIWGFRVSAQDQCGARRAAMGSPNISVDGPQEDSEELDLDLTVEDLEEITREVSAELSTNPGAAKASIKRSLSPVSDVTSKSFGIYAVKKNKEPGVFHLITRNTRVPAHTIRTFYTEEANQERVVVRIMESEASETWTGPDCAVEVGSAILRLPRNLPADSPVEISFVLNRDGRLVIKGVEITHGKRVEASVDTSCVLSGAELRQARERCQGLCVH